MNILQLTNKLPYPPKDGGSIATLNMALGFTDLGHNVTLLAMNTSKHYFNTDGIPTHIKERIKIHDVEIDTEINLTAAIKNLLFSQIPYNAERFISKSYNEKLTEILKSDKFDIIQLEGLYLTPYINEIKRHSKAPIALRAHNIEHEIWERISAQKKSQLKKWYCYVIAKRIKKMKIKYINQYDLLVPITRRDAERFNYLGNKKPVHVAPAGIDTKKLIPETSKKDYPSICHIGTLDWIPNQEGLAWFIKNVWKELSDLHPELKFYIAGRNAPNWINKLFEEKNIIFLGEIDNAYDFINKHDIMIVPLFSGSGIRVKIIEGMALGKAIITTSVGIEGIPAKNGKDVIIEDNSENFIKHIDKLIKNRKKIDEIGKNAIKFAKTNFDNTNISAKLIDFYTKSLK